MSELSPPAVAVASKDGDEVCRLWVADGESHVELLYGIFGDEEPRVWGMLLADVAAHIVRAAELNGLQATDVFAKLESGFRERLANNPTKTGGFSQRAIQ